MPASEAQIRANRENAKRSKGPSEAGKLKSRLNATKHGLTALLPEVEAALSPEFIERRAEWDAEQKPIGKAAGWALDRAVAASFRIERCEHAIDGVCSDAARRATLGWDEDRAVEAANVFDRLPKEPILASRQLQTTLAGVCLLIDAWLGLAALLEQGDWSESDASKALDLLGVAPDFRSARTPIDAPQGVATVDHRRELALEEIERLEALRDEAMAPLDEAERRHAMSGDPALLSDRAKLMLRYERDAWKRYNQAMKEVKAPPTAPTVVTPPPQAVAPDPIPTLSRTRPEWIARLIAEDPTKMTEMDREIETQGGFLAVAAQALAESDARKAQESAQPLATKRTRFADDSVECHLR